MDLKPGTVFAERYEVIRCLGVGGMGAVYEVLHTGTRRRRALKVLHPGLLTDADARERFTQEASISAKIESEHIVDVFDASVDPGTGAPFIVMELLRGYSLGQRLEEQKSFGLNEVLHVLRQAAAALDVTHSAGIVHRDLKPDNLFATVREDGSVRIKILDFGIAKAVARGPSRNTANLGTPLYMAPEQLDGSHLDGRADLFALAHIAFELLTGVHYWDPELRSSPSTMAFLRTLDKGFPEAAGERARRHGIEVGAAFDAWFTKATARAPEERYPTASALVEAFSVALKSTQATPTLVMPMVGRPPTPYTPRVAAPPAPAATAHELDPLGLVDTESAKQTGGPGRWGMVTSSKTKGSTRLLGIAAAIVLPAIAAGLFYAVTRPGADVAGRSSDTARDESEQAHPGAAASASSIVAPPTVSPTVASSAAIAPSASASVQASASTRRTAPPVRRTAAPPVSTKGSLCLKDPRRCR